MKVTFNQAKFDREMKNILEYSAGFLKGIESAKPVFLNNIGKLSIDLIKQFIDANARINPQILHHVYEWNQAGSPDARLFELNYSAGKNGLSFGYSFSQSRSIKPGSNVPFYDKAEIMERGIPVTIKPKKNGVLSFDVDGNQVFTKKEVFIKDPGGEYVQGSFERTMDLFFSQYFTQSFLQASGIADDLNDLSEYKRNLPSGKNLGKSAGIAVGYKWLSTAGVKA